MKSTYFLLAALAALIIFVSCLAKPAKETSKPVLPVNEFVYDIVDDNQNKSKCILFINEKSMFGMIFYALMKEEYFNKSDSKHFLISNPFRNKKGEITIFSWNNEYIYSKYENNNSNNCPYINHPI